MDIKNLRRNYSMKSFNEEEAAADPFEQFILWFEEAVKAEVLEPNALALATASREGKPSCRMVLMKRFGPEGLDFFTNRQSRKGIELEETPFAAATFYWKELERQVSIEGKVRKLGNEESAEYFTSRPRESRLSAWASKQGGVVASRQALEQAYEEEKRRFEGKEIPLPAHWGGYRIVPQVFEFWQGRPNRLHDRLRYYLEGKKWKMERLFP